MSQARFIQGDAAIALQRFPAESFDCCFTSPPYYGLIDYEHFDQTGLERTPDQYLEALGKVFEQVNRVLKEGACCWVVISDTTANFSPIRTMSQRKTRASGDWTMRRGLAPGYRQKEVYNIPLKFVETLRSQGWLHRATYVWDKGGAAGVARGRGTDAIPTSHEWIFQFAKYSLNSRVYCNFQPGDLHGSVIRVNQLRSRKHPCPFPQELPRIFLSRLHREEGDIPRILDPFAGTGTTLQVATELGMDSVGIDLRDWNGLTSEPA